MGGFGGSRGWGAHLSAIVGRELQRQLEDLAPRERHTQNLSMSAALGAQRDDVRGK